MTYSYWVSAADATTGEQARVAEVRTTYSVRICDDCSGEGLYLTGDDTEDPCMECGGAGVTDYPERDD